jgi:acyl-CoA thioester hydrolase
MTVAMSFRHTVRVRYGECDMQGVVFNAHYLSFIDDAVEEFVRDRVGDYLAAGFDYMLKRITIEWISPARYTEDLSVAVDVARWGRTSFELHVAGAVHDRPVFRAEGVYVSTTPGAAVATPVPAEIRAALSR